MRASGRRRAGRSSLRMETLRKGLARAVFAAWVALASPAVAECIRSPQAIPDPGPAGLEPAEAASGPTRRLQAGRVVAPVTVNGLGPYRFIVDTGANRSVLSQGLAERLGLVSSATGQVHSIDGVLPAPLVDVDSLNYGNVSLLNASLPVLAGEMLANQEGLLGVDGMRGRRLRMDFDRRCIEIIPSRGAQTLRGWAHLQGRLRFGHLVVVEGRVRNVRINILIDTGSDVSLANYALRDALENVRVRRGGGVFASRVFTAARPILLDNAVIIPEIRLGDVTMTDVTAYLGNFHIFDLWDLDEEPTLLVGMDVLSQTRAIAIDYERGLVHFRLQRPSAIGMNPAR
jgi:predicted aspartyl protease